MKKAMSFPGSLKILTVVILFIVTQVISVSAQSQKCDMRLNVFLLHDSDFPQDTAIKNVSAKIVNLATNDESFSQIKDKFPYFARLTEGKYNLVVSQKNYKNTTKQINLDCKFVNEKGIFDEIIFLTDAGENEIYQMWQVNLKVLNEYPSPPSRISPNQKSDSSPIVIAADIALNERAIYLPSPVFPVEIKKIRDNLLNDLTAFVIQVNVAIDKKGNVMRAESDRQLLESNFQDLIPYIIESAKKSKFVPINIKGKSSELQGFIIYSFSK